MSFRLVTIHDACTKCGTKLCMLLEAEIGLCGECVFNSLPESSRTERSRSALVRWASHTERLSAVLTDAIKAAGLVPEPEYVGE